MHLLGDVETLIRPPDTDQNHRRAARILDHGIDIEYGRDLPLVEHIQGCAQGGVERQSDDAHGTIS
jgi:hypothetical protein